MADVLNTQTLEMRASVNDVGHVTDAVPLTAALRRVMF